MPRDYEVYLEDIRDAIGKAKKYTTGLSRAAFENDDKTVDAVQHEENADPSRVGEIVCTGVVSWRPGLGAISDFRFQIPEGNKQQTASSKQWTANRHDA